MQTDASVQPREPISDVKIEEPDRDTVYLLPTAHDGDGKRAYMGADALLMKRALADGVQVQYAVPEEEREFVEHFSAGIDLVILAVAVINLIPSTIQGIHALIQLRALRKGIGEEDLGTAEVQLKIDFLRTSSTEARGVEIIGKADGVVAALERLRSDS